jgi:Uma2 family endonuclease
MDILTGMSAAQPAGFISIEEYLAGELVAKQKHEYSAGRVYAMAGARNVHNRIAVSLITSLGGRLRGRPCEPFNSDTKVRVRLATHTRFYYPDAMVVCEPNSADETFQDRPVVIAEVISEATRRIDEGEKREAYLTIATLSTYLLIERTSPRVVVYERNELGGFSEFVYEGLDAIVPLPAVGISLPLSELYERVDFAAAAAEEATGDEEE